MKINRKHISIALAFLLLCSICFLGKLQLRANAMPPDSKKTTPTETTPTEEEQRVCADCIYNGSDQTEKECLTACNSNECMSKCKKFNIDCNLNCDFACGDCLKANSCTNDKGNQDPQTCHSCCISNCTSPDEKGNVPCSDILPLPFGAESTLLVHECNTKCEKPPCECGISGSASCGPDTTCDGCFCVPTPSPLPTCSADNIGSCTGKTPGATCTNSKDEDGKCYYLTEEFKTLCCVPEIIVADSSPIPTESSTPTVFLTPVPTESSTPTVFSTPVPTESSTPTVFSTLVPTESSTPTVFSTPAPVTPQTYASIAPQTSASVAP